MDVDAVADEFHIGVRPHGGPHDPRVPVVERGHSVEHVGDVVGAPGEGLTGGLVVRAGMGQGDAAHTAGLLHKFQPALSLGCHGHCADRSAAVLLEPEKQV